MYSDNHSYEESITLLFNVFIDCCLTPINHVWTLLVFKIAFYKNYVTVTVRQTFTVAINAATHWKKNNYKKREKSKYYNKTALLKYMNNKLIRMCVELFIARFVRKLWNAENITTNLGLFQYKTMGIVYPWTSWARIWNNGLIYSFP